MGGARDRELRQLQKDKEKAQRKGDLKEEAAICNQLGVVLARYGRFQEALEEHRQELRLLDSVSDDLGCAVAHRKIGECLAELESYEAALKHQRRHLELAGSLSNPVEQQRAWATIGRTYMFMAEDDQSSGSLHEAEKAFMESLVILEDALEGEIPEREVSEMRARLYLNLGLVYEGLKNPAKCTYYIKKSIYISEQTHLYEDLYRAYFNLGNMHQRQGEPSKAMRCLERARECACKMKEKYMESECCASVAQVLLSLRDFAAAKRALKKAYLLGSQRPEQRESVCHSLRYAIKASRLQQALDEAEAAEDSHAALGLCEQLGDLFSKAGDYQWSVQAYKKQLHLAQSLKRPEQELAVIHVSLATTFGDLKDHTQAVHHYQAELALRRGNPLEEGKTWLNIALAREEAEESSEEVEQSFQTALRNAEKARDPKLQCQILRHFRAFQQRRGCPEEASTQARLRELCQSQGWRSDGEVSEEEGEELQDSEPLDTSDLELSDSDIEDDLEDYDKTVPGQRRIKKWNQRNDKGETLLHRACIDGNLRRAQFLVEKGHPLNSRDYCGWTPLHEACNHGHLEIVRYLLDHGAAIDDPGGAGCDGITPLHDTLHCGHFDVAELLIQRGASVLLRDAKGQTPLDTLKAWMNLYGRDLDQETRGRCKAMEHLLKKALAGRGPRSAAPREQPASQLFDAELPASPPPRTAGAAAQALSPRRSQRKPGDDCMAPLGPVRKRQRLLGRRPPGEESPPSLEPAEQRVPGLTAPAEYQAAIRGVGSAQFRPPQSPERTRPPDGPALIPPEEYVGDDWLEDDLRQQPSSCKRNRRGPAKESESSAESDAEDHPQPPAGATRKRRRVRQSRLTQLLKRTPLGRTRRGSARDGADPAAESCSLNLGADSNGQVSGMTAGAGENLPAGPTLLPGLPPAVRVRVRVQDNIFLIPVPHSGSESRPVSWLAEQASQRYYQTCGLLPRLTLKKEGALLAPQDRIVDVLQSNEEVLAEVQSWDLPPLVERYRKACRSLAVGEHRLLLKMLERQESGSSFSVAGVTLRRLHLTPLLRALKLQTSIRHLCLSKAGLGNDSAEELLASVSTMPSLKHLDLSHNGLGPEGLQKLAGGSSGPVTFQNLEELDLSLNPLGDGSTRPLAALLQGCPVLSSLGLQACAFTTAFLQHHRLLLASALKGTEHLKRLDVSHNALGPSGLALLLQSLHGQTLTHLDVSAVTARPGDQAPLQDALVSYLAQEGCVLAHLAFSGNCLGDRAVAELARCLALCPSLISVDLSANPEISVVGLRMLLLALEERRRPLEFLSLAGCSVRGPLDSVAWTKLSAGVRQLRLCSRYVSRSDQRDVVQLWHNPAGTTLHAVTRHHKLFCHCL